MFLSDVSIRRPVFTAMMSVCLLVLGAMGFNRLGTDLYPDVSFPVVLVNTVYRGAGPGEIETQVVKPIEDAVAGISGVDKIHSWSRENVATVVVQFTLATDLDAAVQEVRDKVANVANKLPRDADAPVVSRVDLSATPILTYAVSAQLPSQTLRKLLDDRVKPTLAQLEGAAEVRVTGGDVREIQVDIDLDKARAVGVAPVEIAQRIGLENLNLPAGRLQLGPSELTVRSLGQFRGVEELRALPVARSRTGAQVRLEEIATVTDGTAERRTTARLNSKDAIILEVVKQPGSNTVKVSDLVKMKMAELAPSLGSGFEATLLIDQSELIRENAKEVWIALVFGGAMAVLIILLFLLDVRGTFISSLALPTSVVGTFFVMYLLGYTLNQMTLLALSLAIGLLIDDAVVVREAITHRLEQGEEPMSAASNGTKDVGLAVLATTLSLVSVFIPVAFMPGIVGQFFRQFGVTISVAVLVSLFISFTLDPMLSARLARARRPGEVHQEGAVASAIRRALEGTERLYEHILRWVLAHKWKTAGLTLLVLVASFGAASTLGAEFIPKEDRSQFMVDLQLPDSASLAETEARTAEAEALIQRIPEVTDIYSIVGLNGDVNKARLRVLTVPKGARERSIHAIKEEVRGVLSPALVATQVNLADPPTIEGLGDWYPIMVRVTGPDLARVNEEAQRVAQILRDIPGTSDVRVESNPPKPELQIQIDRARSSDVDLSAATLAMQLRLAISGDVAAKLREGTDETDIRVRLAEKDRATPEKVRQLEVYTPRGLRPVTDVAEVDLKDGPSVIEHESRERQIAVYSQLGTGALGDIASKLKERVAEKPLPAGYSVIYDGQMKNLDEQNAAFSTALGLAFIFIYMVLASQFESFKHPFTIMVSLPLALIGALLGLVVTNFHLSLGAVIGVILLMGLVTKNAILLVDGALQHLRTGDSVDQALLKAGPRRLRPILMTSAAMAIGMVPTAVGTGLGAEFRAPMAISIIGGVITSTFLTLLVVPVVFAGMERVGFFRKKQAPQGVQAPVTPVAETREDRAA
ncbi:MAG: efflux RND transporter permease subunit [Myxococcaceae bacterium]|nr:efflux RND transporter permease subunit [Myxococcaceae bacterium]